ncbi:MAG: 4-hydroxy-tetrahydrodipicolinate reductase [Faecalibacterium sp.]|jgi:4-hydroxy-tetrahydrodipicolinate reductase|nr:4-hydroxy-tetrahydrodipicolinate reductase [Faecalibacterium sp.]
MTDILIQGINGRMGHVLAELIAARQDCHVVAGVDRVASADGPFPVFADFSAVHVKADVLIDFSAPAATKNAIAYCAKEKLPCVICTTGLPEETELALVSLSKTVPVFKSANMSMGINLLAELCKKASQILGAGYDVEIIEKHHRNKVDAPSGTALMLADSINEANDSKYHYVYDRQSVRAKRSDNEIGISSVRGGSIVGDHEVLFCGPDEVITLQHTAYSRSVFANGAVNAAVYLAKKQPGLYNMGDMIAES